MFSFSSLKIGARLSGSFGLLSMLVAATSTAGVYGIVTTKNNADYLLQLSSIAKSAADIRRITLDERRYEKDMFINIEDKKTVQSYKDKWDASNADLTKRLTVAIENTADQEDRTLYVDTLANLKAYTLGFEGIYQSILNGEVTKSDVANTLMKKFKENTYKLDENAAKIDALSIDRIDAENANFHAKFKFIIYFIISLSITIVLAAIYISRTITRSITAPMKQALDMTRNLAEGDLTHQARVTHNDETGQLLRSINDTSQSLSKIVGSITENSADILASAERSLAESSELASRNESQAAALEETSASLEEFRGSIEQTSYSTAKANELASNAVVISKMSGDNIDKNIDLMHNLSVSARQINEIITVLDSITFQTNLLALNASVEAARAGEHGRGFSVVASEVRNLANRSAGSASEIRELIQKIVAEIHAGEVQIKQTGSSIKDSITSIETLHTIMNEITSTAREQTLSVEQIRIAMGQIDSATQLNSSLARESRNTAEGLKDNAQQMMETVSSFKI
jgi:methyl-accepting chemotaxis protein